jgi:hypothetical protein
MAEQTPSTPHQQDVPKYVRLEDLVQAADDLLAQVAERTDDDDQLERVRRARQQLSAERDGADDEIATDGGVAVDRVDDDGDVWSRPVVETDRHGDATGFEFVRCLDCGCEVLKQHTDHATHKPGCRHR